MFDVGALIFKIQAAGAQVFQRDMDQADKAIKKVEGSAKSAKPAVEGQGKATEELGKKSSDAAPKQEKQAKATEAQTEAAKTLSRALLAAGTAVGVLVGVSVAKYAEFDQAMSNVRAATMATAAEQKQLADAALEAGADTVYSAAEAAAAQEELAKAGLTVTEIVGGGLTGALSLAAAGQLAVARSAEIMSTTLKQFKLPAEDAAHVSDLLAAGAGKAMGSVEDLSLALSYVGPVAAGLNISIEETAGTLAYFAEQGILGEKAGTSLRGVIMSLTAPSAIAARTMGEYGINVFDASGNMKSLAEISQILKSRLGGLTEAERSAALGRIFGNEQITAARILYAGGAKAIEDWTDAVNDSGYAAEQAAMRQDNLAGDIEKLGGAFDTAFIKTGSGANDVLRQMVQGVTALVDLFGEAPGEVQTTALAVGVLTGAVLLASGAAVGLRVKWIELKEQLDKSNVSMGKTALIGGAVGLALTGVVTVVTILAQKQAEARAKAQSYADAIESGTRAVRDLAEANLQAERTLGWLNFGSAYDNADKLGISLDLVTDAVTGNVKAMEELNEVLDIATGGGDAAQKMADELGISYLDLAQSAGTLREQVDEERAAQERAKVLREQATRATDEQTASTRTAAEAYLEAAEGAEELESQLSQLIDTIFAQNKANLDAREAQRQWIEALEDFDAALAENGTSLDLNTQAGRDNQENLDTIAQRAMEVAEATTAAGGSYDDFRASLEGSRQALIDRIQQLGYAGDEAAAMADEILRIPSQTEWKVVADTYAAQEALDRFIWSNDGRTISLRVATPGLRSTVGNDGGPGGFADGGFAFFAGGGVRENHVAQFARAGEWRVWAEPETGGEAYIPLAPSKRARSEQLLSETARIFGGTYIPAGATGYANGATGIATAAPAGPVVLHLYDIDGVMRGAMRAEIKQSAGIVYEAAAAEKNRRR